MSDVIETEDEEVTRDEALLAIELAETVKEVMGRELAGTSGRADD